MNAKPHTSTKVSLLVLLACFGLSVTACDQVKSLTGDKPKVEDTKPTETTENKTPTDTTDDKTGEKTDDKTAENTGEKTGEKTDDKTGEKTAEKADEKTDEKTDEKAPEVDEAKFINAFFEMTCMKIHVSSTEKQKPISDAILARYEFTQEQYDAAKKSLGEKENVKLVLKGRMPQCNKKAAEAFLTKGSGEEPAEVKKKPAPRPKFYKTRKQIIRNSQIQNGKLVLNLQSNGKVSGLFSGKREGKFFNLPLSGKVDKKGKWRAGGKQGSNRVSAFGTATDKGAFGQLTATINKKSYKTRINAK